MEEELIFRTIIEAAESAKTLGEVKQSIKDINAELDKTQVGSRAYQDLTHALGNVKAKTVDLRNELKALDPEKRFGAIARVGNTIAGGFQAATAAAALFGSEGEDLVKVLVRVQAATALAQGIQSLTQFGKAFQTLNIIMRANPVLAVLSGLLALTAALAPLKDKLMSLSTTVEAMEKAEKKLVEIHKEHNRIIDNQLIILEAQKGKEEEILKLKEKKLLNDFKDLYVSVEIRKAKLAEAAANETLFETTLRLMGLSTLATIQRIKRIQEEGKLLKEETDKLDEIKARITATEFQIVEERKKRKTEAHMSDVEIETAATKELTEIATDRGNQLLEIQNTQFGEGYKQHQESIQRDIDLINAKHEAEMSIMAATFRAQESFIELGRALFAKNKAIMETLFILEKAAAIAKIVVYTIEGNRAIKKKYDAIPGGQAMAAVEIALNTTGAAASIATILATTISRYMGGAGGGVGGGASIEAPRGGGGASAPSIQPPATTNINTNQQGDFTSFGRGRQGEPQPLRAYVVETDITGKQNRIKSIENKITF